MSRPITEKTRSKLLDVTAAMVASGMKFVTFKVAAERKGVSIMALQYAIQNGRLQGYIQHNVKLVAESDLAAYMPVSSVRVGRSTKGRTQTSAQDVGENFGARVRQLRIAGNNMSQRELGEKASIAQGDISDIERGIWRNVSNEHIQRIATALGVASTELLVDGRSTVIYGAVDNTCMPREGVCQKVRDDGVGATDDQVAIIIAMAATLASKSDYEQEEAQEFVFDALGHHAQVDISMVKSARAMLAEEGVGYTVGCVFEEVRQFLNSQTKFEEPKESSGQ